MLIVRKSLWYCDSATILGAAPFSLSFIIFFDVVPSKSISRHVLPRIGIKNMMRSRSPSSRMKTRSRSPPNKKLLTGTSFLLKNLGGADDDDENGVNDVEGGRDDEHDDEDEGEQQFVRKISKKKSNYNSGRAFAKKASSSDQNLSSCATSCTLGLKCPAELSLQQVQKRFRDRESWWRTEYTKLSERTARQLAEASRADGCGVARRLGQIETWKDPISTELIQRQKAMREFDQTIEACAWFRNLNEKRKVFFPWKDISGAGANGYLRKIDTLTKERDEWKASSEKFEAKSLALEKELEATRIALFQSQQSHRMASEDAIGQFRLKKELKRQLERTEAKLEAAFVKITALEKELDAARKRVTKLTLRVKQLEGLLAEEKKRVADLEEQNLLLEEKLVKLENQLKNAAKHTEYWKKKYDEALRGKRKDALAAGKKKKNWFIRDCDFCGAPCFRLQPCDECGHLTESRPVMWRAGWLLRLPRSLLAWKSMSHYQTSEQHTSLVCVSQNLDGVIAGAKAQAKREMAKDQKSAGRHQRNERATSLRGQQIALGDEDHDDHSTSELDVPHGGGSSKGPQKSAPERSIFLPRTPRLEVGADGAPLETSSPYEKKVAVGTH
ncbi:unnamed protein product [Amoebophrya sp. A25]|nr:unnamed protein product [Amoebophrya sp. A25]|eukprot:GSA25T00018575001.1